MPVRRVALLTAGGLAPCLSSAVGGLIGSIILVFTSDDTFSFVVPFFILAACALLAAQDRLRQWLRRSHADTQPVGAATAAHAAVTTPPPFALLLAVFAGAIYGGFFGAGLGIMLLAVMGIVLDEIESSPHRLARHLPKGHLSNRANKKTNSTAP